MSCPPSRISTGAIGRIQDDRSLLSIIAPYAFQAFQGELIQARPFIHGKYERRLNQLQASNRAQELGAVVRFSLEDNNWLTGHNSSVWEGC